MLHRAGTILLSLLAAAALPCRHTRAADMYQLAPPAFDTRMPPPESLAPFGEPPLAPVPSFSLPNAGDAAVEMWDSTAEQPLLHEDTLAEPLPHRRRNGSGLSGGSGFMGGGPPGYEATWYPSQGVEGDTTEFGFLRQSLNLGAPVYRDEDERLILTFGLRHTQFDTAALLPDTLRPFPNELWNFTFGLNYLRDFANDRKGGLILGLGSASDSPFESSEELTGHLGAFWRVPARNDRDTWTFMLFYMHGGPVDFPLPLVSYGWNPSDTFRMNIGLPFSLTWEPNEVTTFQFTYVPLLNINAKLEYAWTPEITAFGGYEFLNESYFLVDRVETTDRFFGIEQRLIGGVRWRVWEHASLEVNGGYSFGRYYGEGQSQWDTLRDRIDVDPTLFLGLGWRLHF